MSGQIKFKYQDVSFRLKEVNRHRVFLHSVMAGEKTGFSEVIYIFCDDVYLHKLNIQYLNHDTYTDILTFNLSLPSQPIISEIYISVDRVKENALNLKEPFHRELLRVMIHGLLHLVGYGDHSQQEKRIMRQKEDHYLNLY